MRELIDLAEALVHPSFDDLHHGTSLAAAIEIARSDSFQCEDDGMGLGLSLTGNREVADDFASLKHKATCNGGDDGAEPSPDRAPQWAETVAGRVLPGDGGIVLNFSRKRLRAVRSLKLVPIASEEVEEEEDRLVSRTGNGPLGNARALITSVTPSIPQQFERFCAVLAEADPRYAPAIAWLRSKLG